jgi:predicted AAA+ superfamily ATPase
VRKVVKWAESQGMKIGRQTALNYLEAAEEVFLLFRHTRYTGKPRERFVNPKLYAVDSGIIKLLSEDYSKQLEKQVFVELLRRGVKTGHWQSDSGREVDFVIEEKGRTTLLQVAYSLSEQATFESETSALKEADAQLHAGRLLIVTKTGGERKIDIGGKEILALPAWKWFLGLAKRHE